MYKSYHIISLSYMQSVTLNGTSSEYENWKGVARNLPKAHRKETLEVHRGLGKGSKCTHHAHGIGENRRQKDSSTPEKCVMYRFLTPRNARVQYIGRASNPQNSCSKEFNVVLQTQNRNWIWEEDMYVGGKVAFGRRISWEERSMLTNPKIRQEKAVPIHESHSD